MTSGYRWHSGSEICRSSPCESWIYPSLASPNATPAAAFPVTPKKRGPDQWAPVISFAITDRERRRLPLGYVVKDRKLLIDAAEAKTVRHIYRRYAALGSRELKFCSRPASVDLRV